MLTKQVCEDLKNKYFDVLIELFDLVGEDIVVSVIGRKSKTYYKITEDKVKIDFKGISWFQDNKPIYIFLCYDFHKNKADFFMTMVHELLHVIFHRELIKAKTTSKKIHNLYDMAALEENFIIQIENSMVRLIALFL